MSTKASKILAGIAGGLMSVAIALAETNAFPKYTHALQVLVYALGGLGVTALHPLFGAGQQQPQGLQQPERK